MRSLIGKLLSFMLFIFLLLGVVSCVSKQQPSKKSYEEQKSLYEDIISQYTALLTAKHNGEELSVPDTANMDSGEIAITEALHGIVDACNTAEAAENLGYGYKDLDGNGTPELILLSKYSSVTSVQAIFTISENLPILLEANYGTGTAFMFATGNRFLLRRTTISNKMEESTLYTCHVDGDKMVYDVIYGIVYDQEKKEVFEKFQIVNGNRVPIEEDAYRALDREYQKSYQPGYSTISKLEAPFIHLSLAESKKDSNLPIADFSSYDAIRNTYIEILRCLEKFNSSEWIMGKYDNLFSYPNDRSFEYYTQLLYIAYHSSQPIGYDEFDLNGDGQDELVLLHEDYQIKAIFTQKDGIPVLVDSFVFSYHTCWLDSDGFIHVDRESYDELEYSLYEFTKSGEYKHHYSVIADNYGRYLTKDGKTEPISFEESLEIRYDDYVRYSEPFAPNEYSRNVSELIYTPLIKATDDIIRHATEKTWHKYADLEKTSDKDFARSNTYVTFENVTDTQIDMNIKYVFTFSYPAPDQDHYLLDDTTESTLKFTVRKENGIFLFDGNGIQGKIEFGQKALWIVIEKSSDERFPVGYYCHEIYSSERIIQ